jgi:hypothetical protein
VNRAIFNGVDEKDFRNHCHQVVAAMATLMSHRVSSRACCCFQDEAVYAYLMNVVVLINRSILMIDLKEQMRDNTALYRWMRQIARLMSP